MTDIPREPEERAVATTVFDSFNQWLYVRSNLPVLAPSGTTDPATIGQGSVVAPLDMVENALFSGKVSFDNTKTGFILGLDKGVIKFYIGTPTNYFNFDGTTVTIAGGLTASQIDIPDTTSANSFHVDSSGNTWWGATTFAAAPASVSKAGAGIFTNVTLTGALTGGTLQTATSGQRIRIVAASATTPSQNANSLMLINSSAHEILSFGSQSSVIMRVLPTDSDQAGIAIQNDATLVVTNDALSASIQNSGSSGRSIVADNAGSGITFSASNSGSGSVFSLSKTGSAATLASFTQAVAGQTFNINKSNSGGGDVFNVTNAGTGYGFYLNCSSSSISNNAFFITYAGTGRVVEFDQTNSSTNSSTAFYFSNAGSGLGMHIDTSSTTNAVLDLSNGGTVSSHFKKSATLDGVTIWKSDGTTPNGNLTGSAGDWCMNGDSSKPYFCTGTTNWTAF